MSEKKSTKKMGRPKLPKGQARGNIVPVRFSDGELKAITRFVKASDQNTVSAWLRHLARDAMTRGTNSMP